MAGLFSPIVVVIQLCMTLVYALEKQISVDCRNDPYNMLVTINTDIPFQGTAYVSTLHDDPQCIVFGSGNTSTTLKIPYKGCNTSKKDIGLFMNRIIIQHHPLIISAGDGEYEIGCKMFTGDIQINSDNNVEVTALPNNVNSATSSLSPPEVLLRIYDFENDVFVETVRLGQIIELEITIRDGNLYKGRVSDCDAYGDDETMFPVVRNYCPVDLSISDKVYVDDQSRTTGDFYLYIPFRVFRFLDGSKVAFTCNVIICQDDCPEADCGEFSGMSYGRKKRSTRHNLYNMTVSGEMFVVDNSVKKIPSSNRDRATSSPYTDGRSQLSAAWLIGGAAVLTSFFISVFVNFYLLLAKKREERRSSGSCVCRQMAGVEKEIELIYPSLPLRI